MHIARHMERWKNLTEENKLLKFIFLILLAAIITEGMYINGLIERQKIIIVPPYIDRKIEISGKKANIAYIRMMCEYALNLLLDWTHFTVENRFKEFMAFVDPAVAAKISKKLYETAEEARKHNITQSFHLTKLEFTGNPHGEKGEAIAHGILERFVFDKLVKTERCQFKILYRIKHARFAIISIEKISLEEKSR